jgi:poly-gamma-glutamate synthesis protein (capsule biosynthesis protein)
MGYPFSGLQEYFATDDLTSVNLECVLKEDGAGENKNKEWRFRGLPEYTAILTEGSVELVNIANNHTIDYGNAGYQATVNAIDGVVEWCGKDHPVAVNVKGHMIGFGGCRETTYLQDPEVIRRDIGRMKNEGCGIVIYQCHWGKEYSEHHNLLQEAMARACIRAGADLVIGHHPHVVQGMDVIDGVPVLYSLGNLMFGGTIRLETYDGLLARICIRPENGDIVLRLIPILTSGEAENGINDYCPLPAREEDRIRILRRIQQDTPFAVYDTMKISSR